MRRSLRSHSQRQRELGRWQTQPSRNSTQEICGNAVDDHSKLTAILDWIADPNHMKFGGNAVGSRYGTLKVIEQKFGRCWDHCDVLITLARASGLPARQVYGWLHESEGHVWAEIRIGNEWHHIDATTGTICGSDYIPISTSDDGEMSFVYASMVNVTVRKR